MDTLEVVVDAVREVVPDLFGDSLGVAITRHIWPYPAQSDWRTSTEWSCNPWDASKELAAACADCVGDILCGASFGLVQ